MKLMTKFFGEIDVDETEFILFSHGIPGFEGYRQFIILKQNADTPFHILQSVENSQLAFILIDMERVVPGYAIDLSDDAVTELKLTRPEDAATYAVVVLPEDISKATVNLAAPIVINVRERQGKQVILNNPAYGLKHPLFTTSQGEACLKIGVK